MRASASVLSLVVASVLLTLCGSVEAGDTDVTYSFGDYFDLRIPADPDASKGWMDDAVIDVPQHLSIADLDVTISITHTNAFDLRLFLESPSGTIVLLNESDPFGGFYQGADYSSTTFDDEAATAIEDGEPPFAGRFRPLEGQSLTAFDGQDAYGSWKLEVYDAFAGDTGSFDSFTLTFSVPEPATVALLVLGLGLAGLPLRRGSTRRP